MNSGIYTITSPSGRQYVGSAVNFANRWRTHLYNLRRGKHHSPALQNAYNKYGESALAFAKFIICAPADLLFYEQRTIDAFSAGRLYNVSPVAGSQLGFKHSDETKAAYSATRRGVPKPRTAEHTQKIANARRGKKLSDEARANQSAAQKGRAKTAEHVEKVAAANRGKIRSVEVIEQMRAMRANKPTKRTEGFVGVSRVGPDAWQARASIDGKRIYLGRFSTAEYARDAILAAINEENP